MIQVPDTRAALGKLARYVRQQLRGKVIAVAGSNGKTGTKLLIDAALRDRGSTRLGLAQELQQRRRRAAHDLPRRPVAGLPGAGDGHQPPRRNPRPDRHRPARHRRHHQLPAEHLEFLGDLVGVRRENASIVEGLNPDGLLVVNGDDPELLARRQPLRAASGSRSGSSRPTTCSPTDVVCDAAGIAVQAQQRPARGLRPVLGRHTACNALAAIAVGRRLGLSEDEIIEGLAKAKGPEMRLQLKRRRRRHGAERRLQRQPRLDAGGLETLAPYPRRAGGSPSWATCGNWARPATDTTASRRRSPATAALDALVCVGPERAIDRRRGRGRGHGRRTGHALPRRRHRRPRRPRVAARRRPGAAQGVARHSPELPWRRGDRRRRGGAASDRRA